MTARKQPSPPEPNYVQLSPALIKWVVGIVGGVFLAIIAWWQIWDRIDNHWRLETTQKARDDKSDVELKAMRDKAAADLIEHKKADLRSQSWTLSAIYDFRAAAETKWAEDCAKDKRPPDICRELERKAAATRERASQTKDAAMNASKEGP